MVYTLLLPGKYLQWFKPWSWSSLHLTNLRLSTDVTYHTCVDIDVDIVQNTLVSTLTLNLSRCTMPKQNINNILIQV